MPKKKHFAFSFPFRLRFVGFLEALYDFDMFMDQR